VKPFQPVIPPHVAEIIQSLHSDLKQSIKAAVRPITADPECGVPLRRELEGLRKFRVRRFRIVYAIDRKSSTIRLVAVGHRQTIYEELTNQLRKKD